MVKCLAYPWGEGRFSRGSSRRPEGPGGLGQMTKVGRCPRQRHCLVKDSETKQEQHVETAVNGGSNVAG